MVRTGSHAYNEYDFEEDGSNNSGVDISDITLNYSGNTITLSYSEDPCA